MTDDIITRISCYVTNEEPMPVELVIDIIEEIERLRKERNQWQAAAAGLSQDISNAEDEIEQLNDLILNLRDDFIDVDDEYYDNTPRVRRKPPKAVNRYILENSDSEERF